MPEEESIEAPDRQSQLEDLLGHVRRCERMAKLDDRLGGGSARESDQ